MIESVRKTVTTHTWIYALPAGLASAALVTTNSPQSGLLDYGIVFWAGLLGGILTIDNSEKARKIGFLTGAVGSLPVIWNMGPVFGVIPSLNQPIFAGVVQTGFLVAVTLVAVLVVGMVGAVGAVVGEWVSRRFGSENRPAVSS